VNSPSTKNYGRILLAATNSDPHFCSLTSKIPNQLRSGCPSPKFPGSFIVSLRLINNCSCLSHFTSSCIIACTGKGSRHPTTGELITPHHQQLRYHLLDLLLPRKAYTELHSTRATVVFSQGRGQIPAHASHSRCVRWLPSMLRPST